MNDASGVVLFERAEPRIALVTINRPEARNAVNGEVAQGLGQAVARVEDDTEIWVAVLTGAGPHAFCAGADLKAIAAGRSHELATEEGGFAGFVYAKRSKPWIAAVQGHALAGGLEITLACDMVVAAETATFGLPEVKRSLIAAAGGLFRLPRALPRAIALEMIATGEAISAARAAQFGLVNRLVPAAHVREAAFELARAVCTSAPLAVRESLRVARAAYDLSERELRELCDEGRRRIWQTEDFKEGPRAFIDKRAPRWVGR
jgi:enoyl-CoA hydratase/carnithine racemase